MENIDQIKADIRALLPFEFEFNQIVYLEQTNRLSVSIEARINGKLVILHQSEKTIAKVAEAINNEYNAYKVCRVEREYVNMMGL